MNKFGIDEEEVLVTDESDRLQRPIAVAIFGCLISTASVAIIMVKADIASKGDTAAILE